MLKLLAMQKKRSAKQVELKDLRAKRTKLRADEQALEEQINALDEITPDLEEQVDTLSTQISETNDAIEAVLAELETIDETITELENQPEPAEPAARSAAPAAAPATARRSAVSGANFNCRSRCFQSRADMTAFYERSDVKGFLDRLRTLGGSGRRSVKGADLTIPTVMLELIRENLSEYSKLITRVRLRSVSGTARQNVTGKVPEGVWTEMCANLNELEFAFTQVEVDGYKVGGYIPVCNAVLEDSDLNLGEEIMQMLMRAIGKALDKAIVYGTGPSGKMPVGIVTRLAQTSQPAYWGADQGTWTDLHSSHVLQLDLGAQSGVGFFTPLLAGMGKAEPDYSDDKPTWIMNRTTHMAIVGKGLAFDAAGALVSGIRDAMPVENGEIVELDFIPDNDIVGGFLDCYLLAERDGGTFASSEHVRFIEDQTVFKGTARYDGQPVIGEAFVAMNINNTAVTTTMAFAPDYANTRLNALICTAAQGGTSGETVVTVSGAKADSPELLYAVGYTGGVTVGMTPGTEFDELTSGTTAITAAAGAVITVVEVDGNGKVISGGSVISVPKT